MNKLFCFGFGYTAQIFANSRDWDSVYGTHRNSFPLDDEGRAALRDASHVLISIPPDAEGDLILRENYEMQPDWVGYLGTTGVYGNHNGGWVDEETPSNPNQERSKWRVIAENQWLESEYPVQIFRLSGIYGAGRSAFDALKNGNARRIEKENQFFSRIHVEDIAQILLKSIEHGQVGEIYNCADDFPCPQEEVVRYAAEIMGVAPPPLIPFTQADLSEMARSFYSSSRRVKNNKIKEKLGVELAYPTYKEGLQAIWRSYNVNNSAKY